APRGLVAQSPAVSPAHTPAEPGPDQTGRKSQTADVGAVPLVESHHQGRVAQCHWCRAVWDLARPLYSGFTNLSSMPWSDLGCWGSYEDTLPSTLRSEHRPSVPSGGCGP